MRRIHDQKARPEAQKFLFFEPVSVHIMFIITFYNYKRRIKIKSHRGAVIGETDKITVLPRLGGNTA